MDTREEIKTIRDKYTDMYDVAAYTHPIDYAVFLESEILALKVELNQANDADTRAEPALPIQNVSKQRELLIAFADWCQYNGKWMLPEKQVKYFLEEQKSNL